MSMNRRIFLKAAVSTTAIGLGGFEAALAVISQPGDYNVCKNCSTVNIETWRDLLPNCFRSAQYCHGCGINMVTTEYDVQCDEMQAKGACGCGVNHNCCQVPFANHALLKESTKPSFMMSKLHF